MDQREISPVKLNVNCISGDESVINDSDHLDNICGKLTHTWQWQAQNSRSSSCLRSYECDCDELNLTKASPCSIKTNASLRAVAQYYFDNANPYEYEIIDIQASPDTGHIMHPPDPCLKHNRQNQQPR